MVASTPVAAQFLADTLALMFPEKAQQYGTVLLQAAQGTDPGKQLVQALFNMVQEMIKTNPHELDRLQPQEKAQFQNLMNSVQGYLNQTPAMPMGGAGKPQQAQPQQQKQPQQNESQAKGQTST